MHDLLFQLADYLVQTIGELGYIGIVILMAIESSVIPLPSEVIMPPAGVHIADGQMTWFWVIFSGTLGSWIGASVNYLFSLYVGRPFLERYGRYFFIREKELKKSDELVRRYGALATFIGRLLPGIRHLISIPAGLTRMNYFVFSFYTCLGAAIWVSILTYAGFVMGKNREQIALFMKTAMWQVMVIFGIILFCYIVFRKLRCCQKTKVAL